jgi:demethylmenaquinone methyltransferase / 2-methoxy-6-polyprenyl-1,4-benzoquinol methylase
MMLKVCRRYLFCSLRNENESSFGYQRVNLGEKQGKVNEVFHSVAENYDLMNDILSLGLHRCWKQTFVQEIGK